jgi:benzoyl-CoA reductase/2-hydroxyglutaryl-CoA dehydratase subunit BcrC/BadD/HgdB
MFELLELCGFESHELESELPRIKKAFDVLGINAEDIERGKKRLNKYYDIELKGFRKVLRLIVKELVNALLVREESNKKVIYGFMFPGIDMLGSALVSNSSDVFVIHHSWAFQIVVGCIFGKIESIMEEAEGKWLKAGLVAHCANVKTIVGPIAMGLFPKPDLLVTAGYLCETSPKTLDILHELYDIPVWFVDTCQDRSFSEYPEPPERIAELTMKSLRRLIDQIQEVTDFEITDDMVREVQNAKRKLDIPFRELRDLVQNSDPLPISPTHDNIWMCLNSLTLSIDGIDEAAEAITLLSEELQSKVARGEGVVEKGAPRVLALLPAGQTDPRLEYLACEVGIAIVANDLNMHIPFKNTSDDPFMGYALGLQQSSLGLLPSGRIPMIIEGCKRLKIDGVLDRYHVGCRVVAGDALLIEDAIRKELGIPVLLLEWENFDPRAYNHELFRNRLDVFKSMMTK